MTPAISAAAARRLCAYVFRCLLAAACAVGAAAPALAAGGNGTVDSIVVRYRDGIAESGASLAASGLAGSLRGALGFEFTVTGTTRDGALTLQLAQPMPVDDVRAALNRLREDGSVLYANVAAGPAGPAVGGLPTNRIIVKFRDPGLVTNARANVPLDSSRVTRLATRGGASLAWLHGMFNGANVLQLLQFLPATQVEAIASLIALDPEVEWAEPDYIKTAKLVPTDPCYASAGTGACNGGFQWDLFDPIGGINMPAAWNVTTGSAGIFVAVIDTGALFNHPDLIGRWATGYDMISDSRVGNDGNARDTDPSDTGDWITSAEAASGFFAGCPVDSSSWHGSHVAGTIAATPNNGIGIAGINWVSKVVPMRVLGKCGGFTSDIAAAMVWAVGGAVTGVATPNPNPARVLSLSLGGGGACDTTSQNAINTALAANAVVVVAAGNENANASTSSPGNCNGVITVAATNKSGRRSWYSNYGTMVEIAAPGGSADGSDTDIVSTINAGTQGPTATYIYQSYAGTSMATPHVSGVASLMLSVNPALTPSQVLSKIQTTARAFPAPGPACNATPQASTCNCTTSLCGAGILDAGAAVASAVTSGTTVASSLNPSTFGASVTFTATVVGSAPTGTVNFKDGGVTFGGCGAQALTGSGNTKTATCTTSALTAGTHSIVATYSGDGSNASTSSPTLSQVVNQPTLPATTTTVGSSANPANLGAAVTFTATVTGTNPTGTVNFKDGGTTFGGCGAQALAGAGNTRTATCTTSGLAAGTHSIVATYSGDAGNATSSSAPLSQSITAPSGLVLVTSANPSPVGAALTLTATITGNLPTGFMIFYDGTSQIAGCTSVALAGTGNTKTSACTTSALAAGTHSLKAVYSGDRANPSATSNIVTQTIGSGGGAVGTTTGVGSSSNPSTVGALVTFTATVTGNAPTGTVNFLDGASSIAGCSAQPLGGSGNARTATCATSALAQGTHNITASYGGDAGNLASQSSVLAQVVNAAAPGGTTTVVGSSSNPSTVGASVTFTATVTGTSPTGTVNFQDGAASIAGCAAQSLTGTGNVRTATCTTSALTQGTHSITASYGGDAGNLASSGGLSQVVNPSGQTATTTTLVSTPNPSTQGSNVAFTATVTGSAPTGTVSFKDGANFVSGCTAVALTGSGNTRTAACVTSLLSSGTHSMTAVYSGDAANLGSTSSVLTQTVNGGTCVPTPRIPCP